MWGRVNIADHDWKLFINPLWGKFFAFYVLAFELDQ